MKRLLGFLTLFAALSVCIAMPAGAQTATDADFDGDGKVGFGDFLQFRQAFNTVESKFDLNGNGRVDLSDFLIFRNLYGETVGQETIRSQVVLPANSTIQIADLKIVTPVTSVAPAASGDVSVATTTVSKPQVVLVENAQGKPVLLSYVMPASVAAGKPASGVLSKLAVSNTVEVSTRTTAVALVMMNPLLAGSTTEQRAQIVESVTKHANFASLISQIETRLGSDPNIVLDGLGSEALYETATGILVDVLTAGVPAGKDVKTPSSEDPWIADPDASHDVIFVNPNYVYYCVGISNRGSSSFLATQLLMTRSAFFELLRWPPVKLYDESRSDPYPLSDGDYTVMMTKGGNYTFSRIIDLDDPVGQATLLNFAQMIFNTLDVVLSLPVTGIGGLATNLGSLNLDLNATDISAIGLAVSDGDVKTLITEMIDLTLDNVDNIASWLWQSSAKPENISQYTTKLLPLLKNVALPLKVLGAANKVPFFYDLVAAPKEVTYDITQANGVLDVYTPSGGGGTPGDSSTVTLTGSTDMTFVYIAPGTFVMGSPDNEVGRHDREGPQHEVTISEGFYLGKYEVTQGQWEAVMGTTPWSGQDYVQSNSNHPAVYVSWNDAQTFVQRLNAAAGDSLYRLPSEAEWEYACRAGTTTRWSFGDDEGQLTNYAWYYDNAWNAGLQYAQPVGTKLANPWGLHDMHGNVWEWCGDWYGDYSSNAQTDPQGPSTGSYRVRRGGYFNDYAQNVRSAYRSDSSPGDRYGGLGFRLLRRAQ